MVLPVLIGAMAAGQLASAYMQWRNSEDARSASQDELAKLDRLASQLEAQQPQFDENGTPIPSLDTSRIDPEDFKLLRRHIPQLAPVIDEVAPQVIQENATMSAGRDAQMSALQRLRQISEQETDPALEAQMQLASRKAQADAQSRQQSLTQDFARRGQLGSGAQLAAQLGSGSQAMASEADLGQQAAIEAYRNRLQAMRESANLGGDIRGQEENMQGKNASIINAFNQRMSANRQNQANMNAGTMNQADMANLQMEQDLANRNVTGRNVAAIRSQDLGNEATRFKYGAQESQRNALNDLKQRKFGNQTDIYGIRSGLGNARRGDIMGAAQDQNKMIQGVGDVVGAGAKSYMDADEKEKDRQMYRDIYTKS